VRNADFEAGVPYLVTDLAGQGSAAQRMPAFGVAPALAVRWVRSASRGAARTHDAQLLHRDIKPDNLFINDRDEALLGDFGIAHLMDPTGRAPYGGTLETMAPEVAAYGETSVQSDIYSLGATLYAMLAGTYPFQDPDPVALRAQIVAGSPTPLRDAAPHVPIALAQRVSRAMALDPAARFQRAEDLEAALGQLPVPARHWIRTDEHSPRHIACWRGEATGKAPATVCLHQVGARAEVIAMHAQSGRRITQACRAAAPQSALPRNLRAAMAAVP